MWSKGYDSGAFSDLVLEYIFVWARGKFTFSLADERILL